MTSEPRRAYADAISVPDAPAPTTASVAGSSVKAQASSVPMTRPPKRVPGSGFFCEPVARMTNFAAILGAVEVAADLDVGVVGDDAVAVDDVDGVLLEEPGHAAGERLDDLQPPRR